VAAFGENHIFTSFCHDRIALAYRGLKQYNKALEHFRKALEIRRLQPTSEEGAIQQSMKYIEETEKIIEDEQ
jgi:tetratricopeptide (TPR) repeat protein